MFVGDKLNGKQNDSGFWFDPGHEITEYQPHSYSVVVKDFVYKIQLSAPKVKTPKKKKKAKVKCLTLLFRENMLILDE